MTLKRNKQDLNKPFCNFEDNIQFLGKKWTVLLLRDLLLGKKYFSEFKEDKPELSNKVLSERLKELEKMNIISKNIENDSFEYFLTEKGQLLNKIIYEIAIFNLNDLNYDKEKEEAIKRLFKKGFIDDS
ncbi:winged helix-turn-helix transcriptional regulator [Methanobrevibacter woesei]|uniref:winged helix-turn-helix transcriptional regulator n=1 Tax=Methanobrevibacter woesei TaxID=190976 RepID=UPI0026DF516E|nr:helix-turn-helix domain-containing protein [Methanobrevibacter woesei]